MKHQVGYGNNTVKIKDWKPSYLSTWKWIQGHVSETLVLGKVRLDFMWSKGLQPVNFHLLHTCLCDNGTV